MDTINKQLNQSNSLYHEKATFDIIITKEVEQKIRYLCTKISNIEWSGFLFYIYEGSIQNKDLKIICKDIYLKDIGNSKYTEFDTSLDETAYMVDNDLMDCQTGLIHSHHTMAAFFSGTDLNTLASEGLTTNSFVSLIVNNAGNYVAAVTERVEKKIKEHITNTIYSFANTPVNTTEEKESYKTEVKYYNLNIVKEATELSDLEARINEIKESKKSSTPTVVAANNYENLPFYKAVDHYTYPLTKPLAKEKAIAYDTHLLVAQLLTMSLCINALKFDIKNWVSKMDNIYKRVFPNIDDFYTWGDTFVDYIICSACSEEPTSENLALVATDLYKELEPYKNNQYILYYMDMLNKYCE